MRRILLHLILTGLAFWALDHHVFPDQITMSGPLWGYGVMALVFSLIHAILRPILKLLSLPLNVLTFGIFSFVISIAINATLLWVLQEVLEVIDVGITLQFSEWTMYPIVGVILSLFLLFIR